ncbi:Folate-dependent protein for Fe/S cluster synthesis/repair in oxidative stress [Pseudoalteromonas luteoviolacea B = ATCC 29581]|nr:Folate-dependent protein for Fe/S cluster synthesis/repair in oxidative stress [Pseudoalteromonas luteoviolacea B = ATCC 29581]
MLATAFTLNDELIQLEGQDKLSYLHGQITQDVNLVTPERFKWAGHCSPKGKLWGVFRLFKHLESYFLLGSPAEIAASLRELKKYGVFAKVEIHHPEFAITGLITQDQATVSHLLGFEFAQDATCFHNEQGDALLRLDATRLILIQHEKRTLPEQIVYQEDNASWYRASHLAGEPRLGSSGVDEYVPQMVNLQALDGISFKKGCYTGQETVARMRYLGKNKRAMYIATGKLTHLPTELDLEMALEDNWRRANSPIDFSFDPKSGEFSALIVLPNDATLDTVLRFKSVPERQLKLHALPYSLEDPQ